MAYIKFTVFELIRRHHDDPRSQAHSLRDDCDEIKSIIPCIDAFESLAVCFESIVTELDKAGCIVKGKLRVSYKIAKAIINDWYDAICDFIGKLLKSSISQCS